MSENLVNQLTLSYMISKQQLAKLNKKIKEDNDSSRKSDKDNYKERLQSLFNGLLNDDKLLNWILVIILGNDIMSKLYK